MENMTFEKAIERIGQINSLISSGEATLDESLELFKEATGLISYCNKRLQEAKLTVEECRKELSPDEQ